MRRQTVLDWYGRNREVVDRWLSNHSIPSEWMPGDRDRALLYAFEEMPNPETLIGAVLLRLGF